MAKPNLIASSVDVNGDSWDTAHGPTFLPLGLAT